MGAKHSNKLDEDRLNEYSLLTYLNKTKIKLIYERFCLIDENKIQQDINTRFSKISFLEICPELKFNPFQHQIVNVFSSKNDNCFSFEDFLNFYSIFSNSCPVEVKMMWIFKIFDIDNDGLISKCDLTVILDQLTGPHKLMKNEIEYLINVILKEIDFHGKGGISTTEFINLICKTCDLNDVCSIRI